MTLVHEQTSTACNEDKPEMSAFGDAKSLTTVGDTYPWLHPLDVVGVCARMVVMLRAFYCFICALHGMDEAFQRIVNPYLRHAVGMLPVGILLYVLLRLTGQYYVDGVGYAAIQDVLLGGSPRRSASVCAGCCRRRTFTPSS